LSAAFFATIDLSEGSIRQLSTRSILLGRLASPRDANCPRINFLTLGTFVVYTFTKLPAMAEVAAMPLAPADAQTLPWPKKVQE
jgi:hypothetical protein